MPIFSVEGGTLPVPPPPGGIAGVGRATVTWFAPDGSIWPLTSPATGVFTLGGVAGIGAIPVALTADDNPRGGTKVRHVRRNERLITWPLQIHGVDHQAYIDNWRAVLHAITQTDEYGPGVLEIARPDGSARRIAAYYQDGFDSSEPYATDGVAALTLYCEDPAWYDPVPVIENRAYISSQSDFLSPFPSIGTSQVLGDTTITNPGKVKAWPKWTVFGPADSIQATLGSTGETWTLDPSLISETLVEGEWVVIDTNPPKVYNNTGDTWSGALNWPGAQLFGIPPGTHDLSFVVSGADSDTRIQFEFYPRHRSA